MPSAPLNMAEVAALSTPSFLVLGKLQVITELKTVHVRRHELTALQLDLQLRGRPTAGGGSGQSWRQQSRAGRHALHPDACLAAGPSLRRPCAAPLHHAAGLHSRGV